MCGKKRYVCNLIFATSQIMKKEGKKKNLIFVTFYSKLKRERGKKGGFVSVWMLIVRWGFKGTKRLESLRDIEIES